MCQSDADVPSLGCARCLLGNCGYGTAQKQRQSECLDRRMVHQILRGDRERLGLAYRTSEQLKSGRLTIRANRRGADTVPRTRAEYPTHAQRSSESMDGPASAFSDWLGLPAHARRCVRCSYGSCTRAHEERGRHAAAVSQDGGGGLPPLQTPCRRCPGTGLHEAGAAWLRQFAAKRPGAALPTAAWLALEPAGPHVAGSRGTPAHCGALFWPRRALYDSSGSAATSGDAAPGWYRLLHTPSWAKRPSTDGVAAPAGERRQDRRQGGATEPEEACAGACSRQGAGGERPNALAQLRANETIASEASFHSSPVCCSVR